MRFRHIDVAKVVTLAIGDSSFVNAGKNRTASQADLIILIANNTDRRLLRGEPATGCPLVCRSHRAKRATRSTLAA